MIKKAVVSGVKWTSVSQIGRQFMQWITIVILARILSPSDFGLVGMAMVVIGFVTIFKDLGTSAAIIQRKEYSDDLLSSVYWVNVTFGFLATIVMFLLSPLIGAFYEEARVTALIRVLSLTFFISGLSILHQALLERQLAFSKLAKLELAATMLSSIVGIASALLGFGVWSLVYQTMTMVLTTTVFLWVVSTWRPRFVFHWKEVKSVSSYSLNLSGFNIFNYFARNVDNLLIGRFLGAQDLGYYSLAYRIMLLPLQSISAVVTRVMFPVYSQIRDDSARFRRVFLQITGTIAFLTFPMMIGLMVLREPFVTVIFGTQWEPVVLLLAILAPVGMTQSIISTLGTIYQAKGRTGLFFRWGTSVGLLVMLSFVVGLRWGIVGVATAYAITTVILSYPSFAIPFKLINLPMRELGVVLWKSFLCSIIMSVVLLGLMRTVLSEASDKTMLGILIPVGVIVYLLASYFINRNILKQLKDIARGKE